MAVLVIQAALMIDTASAEQLAQLRARMVEEQVRARGIRDERVLAAMGKVPRERFITQEYAAEAYSDRPIPIGDGQTVSQPYMVAAMIEALQVRSPDRVLEVGTGTGYEAAVLAELAAEVWTIERHRDLADSARKILLQLGYGNIQVLCADGSSGLPEHAPFDKIVVAAGAPQAPPSLITQLAEGGIMTVPVGNRTDQQLQVMSKIGSELVILQQMSCRFVPLLGTEGWAP